MRTKELDNKAFETIQKCKEAGKSYGEIAVILTAQGYTSTYGKALSSGLVSNFMLERGVRLRNIKRRTKAEIKQAYRQAKQETTAAADSEDFMLDVIANKGLTKTQKLRVLTALIEE